MASSHERPGTEWLTPLTFKNMVNDESPLRGAPCLLSLVVIALSSCLCLGVIGLALVAGYNDELDAIQTDTVRQENTEISEQLTRVEQDLQEGLYLLARDRCNEVLERRPELLPAQECLTRVAPLVFSLTPPATSTTPAVPITTTATQTATLAAETSVTPATPSEEVQTVAAYFDNAAFAMDFGRYEEAIEWLDIVIQVDPGYRRLEVDTMLFTALQRQATTYLRDANLDDGSNGLPGNQLARGIQFARRAGEVQQRNSAVGPYPSELINFEVFIAEGFLAAQAYVAAGSYSAALPILEELYALSPNWGYDGVTISSLLDQARRGGP